ncbi:MAG: DUF192 domain-containing protein [Proteobacteria bacterium]|nr:DUF192 domain-containing protein [Pseudomonadota bacterium]
MSEDRVVAERLLVTRGPLERMRGLLWRAPLQDGEAMYFAHCNAVHTVGMRHAIDVVFLDASGEVLRVVDTLRPLRMAACLRAQATVELAAGQCARIGIAPRQRLRVSGETSA